MRIIAWNIRAGGGKRVVQIANQIERWQPDVIALSEFRGTKPSSDLARLLSNQGLVHHLTSSDKASPRANSLLIAARYRILEIKEKNKPEDSHRWLLVMIKTPKPFYLGSMHVPNRVSGRKYIFHKSIINIVRDWGDEPALLVGDTNSGIPGLDEQVPVFSRREEAWIRGLEGLGWQDAFRFLHGNRRVYSWYSPNGRNGFRLDQAFVNKYMLGQLNGAVYRWGMPESGRPRRDTLSDHAALILDFD